MIWIDGGMRPLVILHIFNSGSDFWETARKTLNKKYVNICAKTQHLTFGDIFSMLRHTEKYECIFNERSNGILIKSLLKCQTSKSIFNILFLVVRVYLSFISYFDIKDINLEQEIIRNINFLNFYSIIKLWLWIYETSSIRASFWILRYSLF